MGEIKLLRTVTGQDIIATVTEETDLVYKVEKALLVQMQQHPSSGAVQIAFAPLNYSPIGSFEGQVGEEPPTLEINRNTIMFPYNPSPELEANYSQATGSIQISRTMPGKL